MKFDNLNPDDFYKDEEAARRFDAVLSNLLRPREKKAQLKVPCIEKLKMEIVHPGRDEQIAPLMFDFRGQHNARRNRQLWNYANAMFLAECDTLSEGTKMYRESPVGHLCGMHAGTMPRLTLQSYFSRLAATPKVCAVVPGLHEYVKHACPWFFNLTRVGCGLGTSQKRRRDVLKALDREFGKSAERQYPYSRGNLDMEDQLLGAIHAAVPSVIHRSIRADLCQDLAVAVLAGDISIQNIPDEICRYLSDAKKFLPKTREQLDRYTPFLTQKRSDAIGSWQEQMESDHKPTAEDLAEHFHSGCHLRGPEADFDISVPQPKAKLRVEPENQQKMQRRIISLARKASGDNMNLPEDFLQILKAEYPKRQGDNGWGQVHGLIQKAVRAGAEWDRILSGTKAYRKHCDDKDSTGTEYVKQARTFYGPGQWWEEWADMDMRSPAQIRLDARWATTKAQAAAANFREPRPHEPIDAYETALRDATRATEVVVDNRPFAVALRAVK